jgi:hypothetical protein
MKPTKKQDWVKAGESVTIDGRMVGKVLRVVVTASLPYATVQWPTSVGRHTITTLRRATPGQAQ